MALEVLKQLSKTEEKWTKFVVDPLCSTCDTSKPTFVIYGALKRTGCKPKVLFFHVLCELGLPGLAEELAKPTDVPPSDISPGRTMTDELLDNLKRVSLRLALAKTFLKLEKDNAIKDQLQVFKAHFDDTADDVELCDLFRTLEYKVDISYNKYQKICDALDRCGLKRIKEELEKFLTKSNPFLSVIGYPPAGDEIPGTRQRSGDSILMHSVDPFASSTPRRDEDEARGDYHSQSQYFSPAFPETEPHSSPHADLTTLSSSQPIPFSPSVAQEAVSGHGGGL